MKKMLSLILLCSMLTGCQHNIGNSLVVHKSEVLEIEENRILVKPYDTIEDDKIYYLICEFTVIEGDLAIGDFIEAQLDTKFMMSYPGQVNAFKIKKID